MATNKSIKEIKEEADNLSINQIQEFIDIYSDDERSGVLNLIKSLKNKQKKYEEKYSKYYQKEQFDRIIAKEKLNKEDVLICGIDEVGRGPLAGEVVVGAVILPRESNLIGVDDSKKLSHKQREELSKEIKEKAIAYSYGIATNEEIDEHNILQATFIAARRAIEALNVKPDILINDAFIIPGIDLPQVKIIKADEKSLSVGCASIIAKVYRDNLMVEYSKEYPQYGFDKNKGYGSSDHIKAIKEYGLCSIHRRSFTKNFI